MPYAVCMESIRSIVVEDHALVGTALCRVLAGVDDIEVVGMATGIAGALELLARCRPDVALLDLRLGRDLVVDHLRAMTVASPGTRFLVLTGWPTEHGLDVALAGGAVGLLSKCQPMDELIAAVRSVHAGDLVVCPELLPALVRRAVSPEPSTLDDGEVAVLEMLVDARSTQQIAEALCLSQHTVRNRIASSMTKLGAHSRVEAVGEAVRRGLVLPVEPLLTVRASAPI